MDNFRTKAPLRNPDAKQEPGVGHEAELLPASGTSAARPSEAERIRELVDEKKKSPTGPRAGEDTGIEMDGQHGL